MDNWRGIDRGRLSRRRYAQLLASGSIASLSGCLGLLDDEGQSSSTAAAQPTDRLTVAVDNSLETANVNQWAAEENNAGFEYLMELAAPVSARSWDRVLSGTTFDAPWIDGRDRISVPTMLADFEVSPPHDVYETYDDRLTYWDGTPIDAEARLAHQKLYWFQGNDGRNALDDATFDHEVLGQYRYHHWTSRGEGEGQEPDERSASALEEEVFTQEFVPLHPEFTQPYRQRYEDATTQSAVDEITEELAQERIGFERLAENGWGSGLYEIESVDDVTEDRVVARARDDHPIDHAGVDTLELRFASPDHEAIAAERGRIDLGRGVVGERGRITREALPEHVQQIDRARSEAGDKVLFDMQDHHLKRLWVRRAIVALVDWPEVRTRGWGEAGSRPVTHDTGLHDTLSRDTFSAEFLDSLHRYPRDYDLETAIEYLERAGYSGSRRDGWESPEGEPLSVTITASKDTNGTFVRASEVIQANLLSLGVDAELELVNNTPGLEQQLGSSGGTDFQLAILWDQMTDPRRFYDSEGRWWRAPLVAGQSADQPISVDAEAYPEVDTYGLPMEPTVPAEVGSIDAPDRAGQQPQLADGETFALPPMIHDMRERESESGEFQPYYRRCARVYNYYLPQFRFHDYVRGAWGNTRDFDWPEPGSELNQMSRPAKFLVRAGVPQESDDLDYPDPDRW